MSDDELRALLGDFNRPEAPYTSLYRAVQEALARGAALAEAERELERRGQAVANAMGRYRGHEPLIKAVERLADNYWEAETRLRILLETLVSPSK